MPMPPTISPEQRAAALEKSARIRKERAELKDNLKQGTLSFGDVLAKTDDPTVGKMKVLAVLESLPGVGKVRARGLLTAAGVDEARRLGGLGARQRDALLEAISTN